MWQSFVLKFGSFSSVQEPTRMLPVSSGVMQRVPGAPFGFVSSLMESTVAQEHVLRSAVDHERETFLFPPPSGSKRLQYFVKMDEGIASGTIFSNTFVVLERSFSLVLLRCSSTFSTFYLRVRAMIPA